MYDTLDNVLADGLSRLGDGAANPGSPWRNVALATVGLDGRPQVRTVVLRRFDRVGRLLDVHTDIRSAKHAELRAHADAALHGWDAEARVQLRVAGKASLHTGNHAADTAWNALPYASRSTYRVLSEPGVAVPSPAALGQADEAAARGVFCVVRLAISALEWLHLGRDGQRRARFTWADGYAHSTWLVP